MKRLSLTTKIFIGLLAGVGAGIICFSTSSSAFADQFIAPIGTIFLNLVKMLIVPLVFSSLVIGVTGLGDMKKLGRIGVKTLLLFTCTTIIAVTIGLFMGNMVDLGGGVTIAGGETMVMDSTEPPSFIETLISIFPSNPLKAMVEAQMLPIIVFALFIGLGITMVGDPAKPLESCINAIAEVMYKLTSVIMKMAPLGVFGLITPIIAKNGPEVLAPLSMLIVVAFVASFLHMIITYSALVKIFAKMNPLRFWKALMPSGVLAFSTCSSSGALPVTLKCTRDDLGVSNGVASFVLPLGATVHMDGTSIYQGVCALFVANVIGVDLSFAQQITIVSTTVLASIGTAGVPGAGFIMLTMVLTSIGLPLEATGLIVGVDRILDMARTTVNVFGDAAVAVAVAGLEGEKLNLVKPSTTDGSEII